jgi:hypothetical protein
LVVAVPAGTRLGAPALLAVVATAAMILGGCGSPPPTDPKAERCTDLPGEPVGLAWSQTGQHLGIGLFGPDGSTGARSIDDAGRLVAAVDDPDTLSTSVVVTPEGRLAWVERRPGPDVLVEDRESGRVETELPEDIFGLGWTAIGFALLQLPPEGGTRVLNLDVDRPGAPTVSFETGLYAERLWISADPETTLLSLVDTDLRHAPVSFLVAGAGMEHRLEPPGADASGASMPSLRRWVVYHSTATSRMEAIRVADPTTAIVLHDAPAVRGMVSDRGILAYVPAPPAGAGAPHEVCLVDVSAKLP